MEIFQYEKMLQMYNIQIIDIGFILCMKFICKTVIDKCMEIKKFKSIHIGISIYDIYENLIYYCGSFYSG